MAKPIFTVNVAGMPSINPLDYLASGLQGALTGITQKAGVDLENAKDDLTKLTEQGAIPVPAASPAQEKVKYLHHVTFKRPMTYKDVLPYAAVGLGALGVLIAIFKR